MASRRLVADRRKERAIQQMLQTRMANRAQVPLREEIARAMKAMGRAMMRGESIERERRKHRRKIEEILASVNQEIATQFAKRLEKLLDNGKAIGYPIERKQTEDREDRIRQWVANNSNKSAEEVSEATIKQVTKTLDRAAEEGLSVEKTAKKLQEIVPGLSSSRAKTIARTETHAAAQAGQQEAANAVPQPMEKEWVTSGDSRVRDDAFTHVDADGQVVGKDELFWVSGEQLEHPGDFRGSPGNIINCRCAVVYRVVG